MKIVMVIACLALVSVVNAQQESKSETSVEHHCSMMNHENMIHHEEKMNHDEKTQHGDAMQHEEMMKHGEMAMGFSQTKSTHHFHLSSTGGFIEVQVNDAADTATRDQIRQHLRHISEMFGEGDSSSPMLTHGRVPPGVPDMRRLRGSISYTYVETESGGKVLISTGNAEAQKAVQEFLRFQIEEHKTGDSEMIEK